MREKSDFCPLQWNVSGARVGGAWTRDLLLFRAQSRLIGRRSVRKCRQSPPTARPAVWYKVRKERCRSSVRLLCRFGFVPALENYSDSHDHPNGDERERSRDDLL
ncbi:hypothetical protein PDJAM_G00070770 [Pangasius djambal]|uniref:Uncharacterized protein n=1 Tax=Pangasius djambal TaxID=1691987 RepID=A0ACC5Z067_9TELE|nr:hypothetical protein [Pangasius djambal]